MVLSIPIMLLAIPPAVPAAILIVIPIGISEHDIAERDGEGDTFRCPRDSGWNDSNCAERAETGADQQAISNFSHHIIRLHFGSRVRTRAGATHRKNANCN